MYTVDTDLDFVRTARCFPDHGTENKPFIFVEKDLSSFSQVHTLLIILRPYCGLAKLGEQGLSLLPAWSPTIHSTPPKEFKNRTGKV